MIDMGKKKDAKQNRSKIDKYLSSNSLDIFAGEDYYDEKPVHTNGKRGKLEKKENSHKKDSKPLDDQTDNNLPQFFGKLLQMFTPDDSKNLIHLQSATKHKSELASPSSTTYQPKDYVYIQMKLNIEHVSDEILEELEEYRLSGIKIRVTEEKDLDIFVKLYNRAFMRGLDPWSPATIEQFKRIISHEKTVVLIASTHGEDVGFIITDLEGDNDEIGVICGLGVDPRWQRQGIARYLGIASWEYFRKQSIKELRCEVYEKNKPSYELIKNLHFTEYGKKTYKF